MPNSWRVGRPAAAGAVAARLRRRRRLVRRAVDRLNRRPGAGALRAVEVAEGVVERVDDEGAEALGLVARLRRRPEEAALALVEVEAFVHHLVPVVARADVEVDAVVDDVRLLRRPHRARVLDDAARDHVVDARHRGAEGVAVHLRDPRRLAVVDVRVARRDVARDRAVHRPVQLRVGAHLAAELEPQRRDPLEVVAVEDVVPAHRLGERDAVGRQEVGRHRVRRADHVAHALRDDDAAPREAPPGRCRGRAACRRR